MTAKADFTDGISRNFAACSVRPCGDSVDQRVYNANAKAGFTKDVHHGIFRLEIRSNLNAQEGGRTELGPPLGN